MTTEQTPPAMPDEGVREARIILISEDHGCQTHGLFVTFDDALAHVKKDGAHEDAKWQFSGPDRGFFLDGHVFWTASREPVRSSVLAREASPGREGMLREALERIAEAAEKGWQGSGGLGRMARTALAATDPVQP